MNAAHGWHWRITLADIEKIKANDRETVNRVYFDNLEKFRKMALKYCFKCCNYDFLEDCNNQIYVDMTEYDYSSRLSLWWDIQTSFRRASMATRLPPLSLEAPLSEDGEKTLLDTLETDGFAELEEREHARNVLEIIAEQEQLTETQRDMLTAIAFGVALYRGIYAEEYRQAFAA